MDVSVKKIVPEAKLPTYGSLHSAGFDFYSVEKCIIPARGRSPIRTGVAVAWSSPTVYLQLLSRSGLCINKGITCEAGVIDWDYLREIIVILYNHSDADVEIEKYDRIAQGIFLEIPQVQHWKEHTQWTEPGTLYVPYSIESRIGGFGSTGK